jgi:hypothetical protein
MFEFNRPAEGELGLADAISQAFDAISAGLVSDDAIQEALMLEILAQQKRINDAWREEQDEVITAFGKMFPSGGWTTEPHPELGEMREEFASSVIAKARQLVAESTKWKTQLVQETDSLRTLLEDQRARGRALLTQYWPEETGEVADVVLIAKLDSHLTQLFAKVEEEVGNREDYRQKWMKSDEELDRLHDHIVDHFPKFGDRAPADAAIEILTIFHTHGPALVKVAWEQAIRPALHVLAGMGIDVLPPGTIVYGAKPKTNIHRPE